MPDGPTELDWARFNLDRLTTIANVTSTLLKAYADYNFRMMEVLEKRIKIETDILKLQIMLDAFRDFKRARADVLRERRKIDAKLQQIAQNVGNVRLIAQGQNLAAGLVTVAWVGIRYFLNNAPLDAVIAVNSMPVEYEHRRAENFVHNRHPEQPGEAAGDDIDNIRSLIEFMARRAYMPRIASPTYVLIGELISVLNRQAELDEAELNSRREAAEEELAALRTADWKTIDVSMHEPKDADE